MNDKEISDLVKSSPDAVTITVQQIEFTMTKDEWTKIKKLIEDRKQEEAMRVWAEKFSVQFAGAVGIINRIQIHMQYGGSGVTISPPLEGVRRQG